MRLVLKEPSNVYFCILIKKNSKMRRVVSECVYLVFGRFVARGGGEVWPAR